MVFFDVSNKTIGWFNNYSFIDLLLKLIHGTLYIVNESINV